MINPVIQTAVSLLGSQQKLATACGVTQPAVWRWLHGLIRPSPEKAKQIEIVTSGKILAYQVRPDLTVLFPHPEQK